MSQRDTVSRYKATLGEQTDWIDENLLNLTALAALLPTTSRDLRTIALKGDEQISPRFPLPLSRLVSSAFIDLRLFEGRPKDTTVPEAEKRYREAQVALFLPSILSAQHELVAPSVQDTVAVGLFGKDLRSCSLAEDYFVKAAKQIGSNGKNDGHDRISVYHNKDGTPIALRKTQMESTALLLEPAVSPKLVPMPAGTIVNVGPNVSYVKTGEFDYLDRRNRPKTRYQTFEVGGNGSNLDLTPLRLSPWAYEDPLDRAVFAISSFTGQGIQYDPDRAKIAQGYSIDDFRQAARSVMDIAYGVGVAA